MQEFAARVETARKRANMSQAALARKLGKSPSGVWRWLNGESGVAIENIGPLAEALACSTDYLLGLARDPVPPEAEAPEGWKGYARVPLAGEVGAGPGRDVAFSEDEAERYVFRTASLSRWGGRSNLVLVRVAKGLWGASMLPEIRPGAVVLYRRDMDAIKDGAVYVVRLKDEGTVIKRLFLAGRAEVVIWADNPATRPRVRVLPRESEEWQALGRVVWVGQEEG